MKTILIGLVSAGFATVTVAGQNPPPRPQSPQTPTAQTEPRATGVDRKDDGRTVTVQGCLMREADVPGLEPNVAERAGVTEDFVLTSTRIVKGGDTESRSSRAGSTGAMFEVEGLDKNQIQSHLNRRVEIDGTIKDQAGMARGDTTRATVPPSPDPTAPEPTGRPKGMTSPSTNNAGDLVELQAKSIRAVPGDCPTAR